VLKRAGKCTWRPERVGGVTGGCVAGSGSAAAAASTVGLMVVVQLLVSPRG
jgi:hypothetical protein